MTRLIVAFIFSCALLHLSAPTPTFAAGDECFRKGHLESQETYRSYKVRIYRYSDACFEVLKSGERVYAESGKALHYEVGSVYPDDPKTYPVPMGQDITGDGKPDLVIAAWSGGAHCCFTFEVFEIGAEFRKIATLSAVHGDLSHFADLDHNGILVFVANDWTFAYWNTSFMDSPAPDVLLRFKNGQYHLAFDLMRKSAPSNAQVASAARRVHDMKPHPWGSPPTDLWRQMLAYIYTGNQSMAWQFLDDAWNPKWGSKEAFLHDLERQLSRSPYWVELREASLAGRKRPK